MDRPATRYARTPGGHVAYQELGSGPNLLVMLGLLSHVELMWEEPGLARFLRRLASFSRCVLFDRRGAGLSDTPSARPTLADAVDDALGVLGAVGADEAFVLGANEASMVAIALAAAQPGRVLGLALVNGTARLMEADGYPIGAAWPKGDRYVRDGTDQYGERPVALRLVAPSKVGDAAFEAWAERFQRASASPGGMQKAALMAGLTDVRDDLADVRCPALVVHRRGDRFTTLEHGLYLAEHLADARLVELPGADHLPWVGDDTDVLLDEVEIFVAGQHTSGAGGERVLATLLFTDIVGSTEHLSRVGDRAWAELVDIHDLTVRTVVERNHGRVADTAGDGVFAVFTQPSQALSAALQLQERLGSLGIRIRAGVHIGEVELVGAEVRGLAVHTAARVMSVAAGDEVVTSRVVRDLTVGSDFTCRPIGPRELKGIPEPVELFLVSRARRA